MEILKARDGETLKVNLVGRLDTTTSPELESNLMDDLEDVTELVLALLCSEYDKADDAVAELIEANKNLKYDKDQLNIKLLDYVSSAGLRVLLVLQKKMNKQGSMVIKNASESIIEVFDITGFIDILTVE